MARCFWCVVVSRTRLECSSLMCSSFGNMYSGDCGTPIWSVTADGGAWVKVGAFVNAGEFEPVCEIFTDHALPGLKVYVLSLSLLLLLAPAQRHTGG